MQLQLYEFMLGSLVMACLVAGLFFLRFWRKTRDRLFLMFAIAFWILGSNWLALAWIEQEEQKTILYARDRHTVIAELCTGCELCLPPCPVDCIDLVATARAGRDSLSTAAG